MTIDMQRRVVAFVRTIANECSSCPRNGSQYCNDCEAKRANLLLNDISFDERQTTPVIDYSFYARVDEIKRIISSSGRPMQAREINLKHTCSPQLKHWTLNQMIENGIIRRITQNKPGLSISNRKKSAYFYIINNSNKDTK